MSASSSITCHSPYILGRAWRRRLQAALNYKATKPFGRCRTGFSRTKQRSLRKTRRKNWQRSRRIAEALTRRPSTSVMSVGLVLKDLNVAESYQINATPTVFINGHRIQGIENAAKLQEMIAEARKGRAKAAVREQTCLL